MALSWIRSLLQGNRRPASRGTRRKARSQLRLEALETRLAPAQRVWDGGSLATNNWNDAANWVGDVAPSPGDDLVFRVTGADPTSFNNTNNFGSAANPAFFRSIRIEGSGYTLGGTGIVLGSGGISTTSATNTINLPIVLNPEQISVDVASGGTLTLGGVISGGAPGGSGNAVDVFFDKLGGGKLILSGTNTYESMTRVLSGALNLRNSSALGTANGFDSTTLFSPGSLELEGGINIAAELLSITPAATGPAMVNVSGVNTWGGLISATVGTVFVVNTGSELAISGPIVAGAVTKTGGGQMLLSGANTYGGLTSVNQGTLVILNNTALGSTTNGTTVANGATLELRNVTVGNEALTLNGFGVGNGGALRSTLGTNTWAGTVSLPTDARVGVDGASILTLSNTISGPAASELRKFGAGNLILTAANTYDGDTVVASGTLTIRNAAALGSTVNDTIVHPGGTLALDGPFDVVGEALTLGLSGGTTAAILHKLPDSAHPFPRGATVWNAPITILSPATIRVDTAETLNLPQTVTASLTTQTLTKTGVGTLGLTGATANVDLNANVIVNDGILLLAKTGGVQAIDGNVIIGDGTGNASSATVRLANPNQIPDTKDVTINRDGLFNLLNNNETINRVFMTAGTINTGTGILSLNQINTLASSETATINGQLSAATGTLGILVADGAADPDLLVNAAVLSPVTKANAGKVVFTSDQGSMSSLFASQGVTFVNGSQPGTTVNVAFNGISTSPVLGGTGTVGRINLSNGTVAPGGVGQTGTLTANGGLFASLTTISGARTVQADIVNSDDHDLLVVQGNIDLAAFPVQLVIPQPADGFFANSNITLILNDGTSDLISGTFANLPQGATVTIDDLDADTIADAVFTISYRGVPNAQGVFSDNDVVLIRNTGSMFPNRTLTPVVTEGGFATLTGTISEPDPLDYFILEVNWGDGTPTESHVFPPGSPRQVSLQHRYLNDSLGHPNGQFPVSLNWHDQHGQGNSTVMAVTVLNANPVVLAGGDVTLVAGQSLSRAGRITDAGLLDVLTATVDYGDGVVENVRLRRDGTFNLRHRYSQPGEYFVTVTATDNAGGVGRTTFKVTVTPRGAGFNPFGGFNPDDDNPFGRK